MLRYTLHIECDVYGCMEKQELARTIERPGEYELPTTSRWDGPLKDWMLEQDQETRCPRHAREERARRAAQEEADAAAAAEVEA